MIYVINIISDSNIGGAGKCILNFLKYYNKDKFKVKVILPKGSLLIPHIEKLGGEYIEAINIAEKSFDKNAVKELKEILAKEKPYIVHTHGNLSGRISAKLTKCKIIYTRHSVFPVSPRISKGVGKLINKTLNEFLSDDIVAVAEAAKDNLTEGGINPKKIQVILNGVEKVSEFSNEEKIEIRKNYNLTEKDFVVGIMARLEPYKGHKYLIEATKILKNKGVEIKTIIAGTGGYIEELKNYAKEIEIEENIIFAGFVSEINKIINIMDIQGNASYGTEATSLALLEGMSIGIPAVVSDYGGNPGVISHGENGLIFKEKNSQEMADCIEKIYKDKSLYEHMKKRSLEIYEEKFTAEIYAKNMEEVYENLYLRGVK